MGTIVLWGRKPEDASYMEHVFAESNDPEVLKSASEEANAQGYTIQRTSVFNWEKPDFVGAINGIKRRRV